MHIMVQNLLCPGAKASRVEEKVHQERLKLVDQYKKCMEKTGEGLAKIKACDTYLKADEALKQSTYFL